VIRRRRAGALVVMAVVAILLAIVVVIATSGGRSPAHLKTLPKHRATASISPFKRLPPGPPSDQRRLSLLKTISGHISPKSVDASDTGLVFAQNMMYTHTVTVYNSDGTLVKTIPDTVEMSDFGIPGHPGITHGAPVEAAFTPDARYVYVSNYSMYGTGFGPEGSDDCTPASAKAAGDTDSYVYRIGVKTLSIDQVIRVGLVPKFLAVTPNGKYLLVSNWCSYDLSIVNIAQRRQVATLPIGPYPRGLAISPDSSTAYVAIMGSDDITKVNLRTMKIEGSFVVGESPRHLVMSPNGRYLYASLNAPGEVVKVDLTNDKVVATAQTGEQDRSLAIAADGRSLYVVNYDSDTITKLDASNLHIIQTFPTGVHPIGITYDATTGDVWVAVYSGQILVLADRKPATQ
jgi:YVTN family beta-propeller protein